MSKGRILHLKRQGWTVAAIARAARCEQSHVWATIAANRHQMAWEPTLEEIAAAKREINRAKGITDDLS